jgi:hypothetical protein
MLTPLSKYPSPSTLAPAPTALKVNVPARIHHPASARVPWTTLVALVTDVIPPPIHPPMPGPIA